MKRGAAETDDVSTSSRAKRQQTQANGLQSRFRSGIFEPATVQSYAKEYAQSEPYRHAVVSNLVDDTLLRQVRSEILDNIHFTPKETDIYKIHQSGDLANLDGLPASALEKLPSLLKLRDALYSPDFRGWVSQVSGAGALSGRKTDMAVNVYVPGCHLLCHDDVIGSRRVSYILYLTDPDKPWNAEWGGALRLYPTDEVKDESGKSYRLPQSEWNKVIPPAWNQLSFFAVQPGESFHDVEEVYKCTRADSSDEDDAGRFRMAISGWFHIPQEGEGGYEPGLEERLAEKSSLQQLQGKADELDLPKLSWFDAVPREQAAVISGDEDPDDELAEEDLEFLLKYMTPNYLTPDTVEELAEIFADESTLQLANFLNAKFADRLRAALSDDQSILMTNTRWRTSRPPHKHRYQYLLPQHGADVENHDPLNLILNDLLPSLAFRKWLSLATGLTLKKAQAVARRFRRGLGYQLAQGYEGKDPQLEYCLCITPSIGWGGEDELEQNDESTSEVNGVANGSGAKVEDNVGGYELYMAGDDDPDEDEEGSDAGVEIPAKLQSQTGAGERRSATRTKEADPAIYRAAADDQDDDGILVSNAASWNTLSLVLRDQGTLKFVKYVSQSAPGDRWDVAGSVEVEPHDDEDDAED